MCIHVTVFHFTIKINNVYFFKCFIKSLGSYILILYFLIDVQLGFFTLYLDTSATIVDCSASILSNSGTQSPAQRCSGAPCQLNEMEYLTPFVFHRNFGFWLGLSSLGKEWPEGRRNPSFRLKTFV